MNNATGLKTRGDDGERLVVEPRMNPMNERDFTGLRIYRLARWR